MRPRETLALLGGIPSLRLTDGRKLLVTDHATGRTRRCDLDSNRLGLVLVESRRGFVSFGALRWLARSEVPLVQVAFNGSVLSVTTPAAPLHPHVRIAQMRTFLDPTRRLGVATAIVETKPHSQGFELEREPRSLTELLTMEARAAAAYWERLGVVRSYPNATDRTNALLNYAYGLLQSRCIIRLIALGADPAIGMLHEPQSFKQALAYDAMELYRWVADDVALGVAKTTGARGFNESTDFGVRFKPATARAVVVEFDRAFRRVEGTFDRDLSGLVLSFGTGAPPAFENVLQKDPKTLQAGALLSPRGG